VISLNLVLAELRLGLKNRQVGEKWVAEEHCLVILEKEVIDTISHKYLN
jgi:hypothetical protein